MSRHLPKFLNERTLRELGDRFDGKIVDVREELIRNRYTTQKSIEPVVVFDSGHRLIPNIGQRKALIEMNVFSGWSGRRYSYWFGS